MLDDLSHNERALIAEVRRLGIDAELMRAGLADSQRWAAEIERLRWADGDERAAKLDRARTEAAESLADLVTPARFTDAEERAGDSARAAFRKFRP